MGVVACRSADPPIGRIGGPVRYSCSVHRNPRACRFSCQMVGLCIATTPLGTWYVWVCRTASNLLYTNLCNRPAIRRALWSQRLVGLALARKAQGSRGRYTAQRAPSTRSTWYSPALRASLSGRNSQTCARNVTTSHHKTTQPCLVCRAARSSLVRCGRADLWLRLVRAGLRRLAALYQCTRRRWRASCAHEARALSLAMIVVASFQFRFATPAGRGRKPRCWLRLDASHVVLQPRRRQRRACASTRSCPVAITLLGSTIHGSSCGLAPRRRAEHAVATWRDVLRHGAPPVVAQLLRSRWMVCQCCRS